MKIRFFSPCYVQHIHNVQWKTISEFDDHGMFMIMIMTIQQMIIIVCFKWMERWSYVKYHVRMHVWVECGNWCTFDRYYYLNKRPRGTSTWSYKKVIFVISNWFCFKFNINNAVKQQKQTCTADRNYKFGVKILTQKFKTLN